jgi:hypothetical protein
MTLSPFEPKLASVAAVMADATRARMLGGLKSEVQQHMKLRPK